MSFRILVASYTDSIATLTFDTSKNTLAVSSVLKVGFHPSWVTRHKCDKSLVFAGLEQTDGKLITLKYDTATGEGKIVSEVSSDGGSPCTIVSLKGEVVVGNYETGTVGIFNFPQGTSSGVLASSQKALQFSGTGPNSSRQEASHPHQVYFNPEDEEILVPDLGADITWRLTKNGEGRWIPAGKVTYPEFPGGGPRHVIVFDGILYTLLELTSTLTAHRLPPISADEPPTLLASSPTLSSSPASAPIPMLAAEILLPPPNSTFPTAYIYVSNRNDPHPQGDTIAIFETYQPGSKSLKLVAEVRTGLNHVRGMIFFGPNDKYFVAGGANGAGIKVFERVDAGKGLKEIAHLPVAEGAEEGGLKPTGFLCL